MARTIRGPMLKSSIFCVRWSFDRKGVRTTDLSAWSSIICQLATLYFNAAFHTPDHEEDRFPGACQARDIPLDPLSNLMGEAYHRWHHQHPKAFQRPGLDLPYYLFILPMLKLGVFHGKNRL